MLEASKKTFDFQQRKILIEKAAASATGYHFKKNDIVQSFVIRCDLNNYSVWSSSKSLDQRVQLLDDFFSSLIPSLDSIGGIFFRDEGDCIVSIFSTYFGIYEFSNILKFCKSVVLNNYGLDRLSAKVSVAFGNVAFFQKSHEKGSVDWSAEGQPFVLAARLEQAIKSGPKIVLIRSFYDALNQVIGEEMVKTFFDFKKRTSTINIQNENLDIVELEKN